MNFSDSAVNNMLARQSNAVKNAGLELKKAKYRVFENKHT